MAAEKHCERCGRRYFATSNRQKYCKPCRSERLAVSPSNRRFVPQFEPRRCEACGELYTPMAWHARWCRRCRPAARAAVSAALYGTRSGHRQAKDAWRPAVASGRVPCVRCGELIAPGARWDLDHGDSGVPGRYLGPAHARCNRGAPMRNRRRS